MCRLFVVFLLLLIIPFELFAQKKGSKPIVAPISEVYSVVINLPVKQKKPAKGKGKKPSPATKPFTIKCYDSKPGQSIKNNATTVKFTPYVMQLKKLKKVKTVIAAKKVKNIQAILKAAKGKCSAASRPPSPIPTPKLPSLARHTGAFGVEEARTLFKRFAFGAPETEIAAAVANGLDATVQSLMAIRSEPRLDQEEAELQCDGRTASDPNNESCDSSNPNDLSRTGYRYGLINRFIKTQNPFYHRLSFFLHDERVSVDLNSLDGCETHAVPLYIEYLRRAAFQGDYKRYMQDMVTDLVVHLSWLDGGVNHSNLVSTPNENFAREFWELGTVGPVGLNGVPNYSDLDIAQASRAFSGYRIQGIEINDNWVCLGSFVTGLHAPGAKRIFIGTPYEQVVYEAADMVEATFNHPRTAEHLAEDIWLQYISPNPHPNQIVELAAVIRANNYNLKEVMKIVMLSEALYHPNYRGTLIKHPVDLLVGFIRETGLLHDNYWLSVFLQRMGQLPLSPETVFGWDETRLAGEQFILEWRNTVTQFVERDSTSLMQNQGFSFFNRLLVGLAGSAYPSQGAIDRVSSTLGVNLTAQQRNHLDLYMNYNRQTCGNNDSHPDCKAGNSKKMVRRIFDPNSPVDGDWEHKVRGLLALVATIPEYRVK